MGFGAMLVRWVRISQIMTIFSTLMSPCSIGWTMTMVLSIDQSDNSSTLFRQYFHHQASIQMDLIIMNTTSAKLRIDLHLNDRPGLLRVHLAQFPTRTPLYLSVTYQFPSALSLSLYGQLVDSTTEFLESSTPRSSSPLHMELISGPSTTIHAVAWSFTRPINSISTTNLTLVANCCNEESSGRSKRDRTMLTTACQCK